MAQKPAPKETTTGKRAAQKVVRHDKNQAQHEANLASMRELGITPRVGSITKTRTDRKGMSSSYVKSYEVRPSKLIRTQKRALAGLEKKHEKFAKLSNLPFERSTAEHLAAAKRS